MTANGGLIAHFGQSAFCYVERISPSADGDQRTFPHLGRVLFVMWREFRRLRTATRGLLALWTPRLLFGVRKEAKSTPKGCDPWESRRTPQNERYASLREILRRCGFWGLQQSHDDVCGGSLYKVRAGLRFLQASAATTIRDFCFIQTASR